MSEVNFEELFVNVAENPTAKALNELFELLNEHRPLANSKLSENVDFLIDSWNAEVDATQANFIISLASLSPEDTPLFRKTLLMSLKALLPPFLAKPSYLRALGLRDSSCTVAEIAKRYHALLALKGGVYAYQTDVQRWGTVISVDEFTSSVALVEYNAPGSFSLSIEKVLADVKLFAPGPDIQKAAKLCRKIIPSAEFKATLNNRSLTPTNERLFHAIAQHALVPNKMTAEKFDEWWSCEDDVNANGADNLKRKASEARSVHELHDLIVETNKIEGYEFTEEDVDLLKAFFTKMRPQEGVKNNKLLLDSISMLSAYFNEDQMVEMLEPLKEKAVFWPLDVQNFNFEDLEVWGKIAVKQLPPLAKATVDLFGDIYSSELITHLPLKCLNSFCAEVDNDILAEKIKSVRNINCDILLWIWRNRKVVSQHLLDDLNLTNVITALNTTQLPSVWQPAHRELKKQLMDKADFQQQIIDAARNDISQITFALQLAKFFITGEKQSLLIKLTRLSPELKALLEGGEAQKLMAKKADDGNSIVNAILNGPTISSNASHRRLLAELDDLLKVQIPENRESLKVARAHGDFRENAEYDAAKERRNFLSKRRSELERDLVNIQATDFQNVDLSSGITVGCKVILDSPKGELVYNVLGAWDGDPEKNYISYKTRLGKLLLCKKAGDKVEMPDDTEATIKDVSTLDAEILEKLA
ncbi:GreA/GreB family elongation factor [Lentisphaerota bacterium WC36G]|nr:GreA/GreB family elongation factor [Lentisphaerae bacterium WC36]